MCEGGGLLWQISLQPLELYGQWVAHGKGLAVFNQKQVMMVRILKWLTLILKCVGYKGVPQHRQISSNSVLIMEGCNRRLLPS